MDFSEDDPPPSPLKDTSPPEPAETADRATTRRSRVTSESVASLGSSQEEGEPATLPGSLVPLGEALDGALASEGQVIDAYSAFADKAFADAGAVSAASRWLIRLFAGQQGVLVNLVRTKDLLAALENGSSELPRLIAQRWQVGAMTQRISRFGESIILHKDRLQNPAAAEVMAVFAALLALHKLERATTLFELACKIIDPPGGTELAEGVRALLGAGQVIEPLPPEQRAFWQQQFSQSKADEDWSSPEAIAALQALEGRIKPDMACAVLFQALVPERWWKQHVLAPEKEPAPPPPAAGDAPGPSVRAATMQEEAATGELAPSYQPSAEGKTAVEPPASVPLLPAAPGPSPEVVSTPAATGLTSPSPAPAPAPPSRRSSAVLTFLTGQLLGMALVAGIWAVQPDLLSRAFGTAVQYWQGGQQRPVTASQAAKPAVPAPVPAAAVPPEVPKAQPVTEGDKWRLGEAAALAAAHPEMKPWITKAQDGTWAECRALVSGQQPTAYPTTDDYGLFLKWLMLDPPHDAEARRAVPRLYVRVAPLGELLDICEHLRYAGSPYVEDIPTVAQVAQQIHALLTTTERERLARLATDP